MFFLIVPICCDKSTMARKPKKSPPPQASQQPGVPIKNLPDKPPASQSSPTLEPIVAFYIFLAARTVSAFYAPIQDCDEVYNYWEPTHYLNHGYGKQTWEYSPQYAIRSWVYSGLHAAIVALSRPLPVVTTKTCQFYFLRLILGTACAACETRLFAALSRAVNPRVGLFFMLAMLSSAGMFHASTAYLPSSFAMYAGMLGTAAFMDWKGGIKTAQGIMWFGIGASIGWPFAGALALPWLAEELVLAAITGQVVDMATRVLDGTVRSMIVLAVQSAIDTFFYKKLVCVPLNIVLYNVLSSSSSRGPDIYGVEPWHFYLRNLALNFNAWFLLALLSFPLLVLHHLFRERARRGGSAGAQTFLRTLVFITPFYVWLAIFTLQPHKEERFMYPAYPMLALNAAMTLHVVLGYVGSTDPRDLSSHVPPALKFAAVMAFVLGSVDLGLLRSAGIVTAYGAPLEVYGPLMENGVGGEGAAGNVCLGKEWYRFPSSYFLPDGMHARYVRSAFRGLLPGDFSEAKTGFGVFPGTWLEPAGMNDRNEEDLGKYVDISECQYLVDSRFAGRSDDGEEKVEEVGVHPDEPDYVRDEETWERVACAPFLDAERTGTLGRLVWVPDWGIIPARFRRRWGEYCLLRRRSLAPSVDPQLQAADRAGRRSAFVIMLVHMDGAVFLPMMPNSIKKPDRALDLSKAARTPLLEASFSASFFAPVVFRSLEMEEFKLWARKNCNPERVKEISQQVEQRFRDQPKHTAYGALLAIATAWLLIATARHFLARKQSSRPGSPDPEKKPAYNRSAGSKGPDRPPGVWPPSDFKRPTASPYPDWSLEHTKPLPYRPFRYGPQYKVTMGLRNMDWDDWIEIDNHYPRFHADKARRIEDRGSRCCRTAPEAFDAACELVEELVDYLPQRYPSLFRRTGEGKMENLYSGERFDVTERPLKEDPMQMAARMVQDDLAIMLEKPDGQYYLLAGAILLAGFWRLEDKFGMVLSEIHTSGEVPQFKEKLEKGMMNFFRRVKPENPVLRNNYFIQVDDQLPWSTSIGDEDSEGIGWYTAEKNKAIEHHYFRSERQSLRRLPRSGGVVFTIHTYFHPITEICAEPYVPGRLASAVRSWGDDVSKYKGKERYQDVLLEYLDRKHEEQVADGLDLSKEEEVRAYPW
ncbi:Alg9-like mannosyltransferase family-domain-containing protein [Lineolata rhizophorae]|uniref:Mannosyltransferase n=1 Tax=Lineolata rhizophorae TaxID=578093 RepID=A0A6A6P2H9_9PEZI|nr:Alg9-like mannosyltransferase family-domain-containing protein [Lineolata rhizophorae]